MKNDLHHYCAKIDYHAQAITSQRGQRSNLFGLFYLKGVLLFTAIFFLVLLVFITPVHAQNTDSLDLYDLSIQDLMNIDVNTVSQRSQKISDAPATVISISADQIEKYGWRDLKDVFRAIPGVDVSYDVQGEVRTLVTFRGVEGNQKILILQDGMRQNPITGERFVFAHNQPLHIYKRIEIIYGPASAIYGADAYSGVINLITKDGQDIDGVQVESGYSSTQAYFGNITFGKNYGDVDFISSFRYYMGNDFPIHEDYTDMKDYGVVGKYDSLLGAMSNTYPIKNWNYFAKIRYKKFTFSLDWQKELESNAPTTIPSQYAYVKNNLWGQNIRHFNVSHQTLSNDKMQLTSMVSLGDYEINPASNFYLVQDIAFKTGLPSYKYGYSGYIRQQEQFTYFLNEKITLMAGTVVDVVKSFPKTKNLDGVPFQLDGGLQDDLSMFLNSNGNTFGMVNIKEKTFGERNYENYGAYMQADFAIMNNLSLTVGGRFDYNSIYKETINPRAGLVYKPLENLSIKALYGTAYIQPSNYYRWENWANPYAMHIPNLDIKPEQLQCIELSSTYYLNKNISLRLSGFRNDMKDIIRPVPANPQAGNYPYYNPLRSVINQATNSGFVEINANQGTIFSQGFEFETYFSYKGLLASAAYSYLDGEDNDNLLPKISQHKINGNASYSYKGFAISLSGRYFTDVQTTTTNSLYGDAGDSTYKFPGAFVLYAHAYYKILDNLKVFVSCDNVLDTKHYGAAPYGESIWIQARAPQALRKIFFGLSFKF